MDDSELYHLAGEQKDNKNRNLILLQLLCSFPDSDYVGYALEFKMSDELRQRICECILARKWYNNEQILFVKWHGDSKSKALALDLFNKYWELRKNESWLINA